MLGGGGGTERSGERRKGERRGEGEEKSIFTLSQGSSLKPRFPNDQAVKLNIPSGHSMLSLKATRSDPRGKVA